MNKEHNTKVLNFIIKQGSDGTTITELISSTGLTRDNIRIAVAVLEGAGSIISRDVGRSKLYKINPDHKKGV